MDSQTFLTTVGGVYGGGTGSTSSFSSVGRSLEMPGTSAIFLEKVNDGFVNLGAAGYTITAFIRPTFLAEIGQIRGVLGKGDAAASATLSFSMTVTSVFDRIDFSISNGSVTQSVSSANSSLTNNTWHFVEITYNATTNILSIAIDRGTATTTSSVNDPQNVSTDFRIGSNVQATGVDPFQGQISLIGLWTRVLTGTELDEVYNLGLGKLWTSLQAGTQADIIGYWELDETSNGSTQVDRLDSSSNDNDMTDPDHISSSLEVPI